MSGPAEAPRSQVIIPLKPLRSAKGRLRLPDHERQAFACAFVRDVVAACSHLPVLVVGDDRWSRLLPDTPVLPDPGGGLNEAITAGMRTIGPGPVLIVMGDLPCLSAEGVDRVALASATGAVYVPDSVGSGTTLLAGRTEHLRPAFGPDSAHKHRSLGYREYGEADRGLRVDVDSWADLTEAAGLGLGEHTARLWQDYGTARGNEERDRPEGRSRPWPVHPGRP